MEGIQSSKVISKQKKIKKTKQPPSPKDSFILSGFDVPFYLCIAVLYLWFQGPFQVLFCFVFSFPRDCQALMAAPAYKNKAASLLSLLYRSALINVPFTWMKLRHL